MSLQSHVDIKIDGKSIPTFKQLVLHQEIDAHHIFEVHCREDVTGELLSTTREYLGKTITFSIAAANKLKNYGELEFKGIITEIKSVKGYHYSGGDTLVISGKSSTVISDDGSHYASHQKTGLGDVLNKTFEGYDSSKLEIVFAPKNKAPLLYSVQNNESAYRYASRLAAQYGEWFYYNGTQLIFGKPENGKEIKLTYGTDLQEFSLQLAPQSNKYNYFTNDFLNDQEHQKKTTEVSGPNGYIGFSSQKGNELYGNETNILVNSFYDEQLQQRLDTLVEQQKIATEIKQVQFVGKSDNPGITVGSIFKVENANGFDGKFRVISVTHSSNENGKYQNNFTALSADSDVYPNTNIQAFPYSDTQVAKVKANNDPEGLGRIQVEFPWQKLLGETTPWLRVVTPHAGGDKGFHFIPELEEEVMIGFEGGNAERPYVLGSMYNGAGKATAFQTEANDIKAIKTRGGHLIELKDANGEESITISDKSGNKIVLDVASSSISITAPSNITLSADTIDIKATNALKLSSAESTIAIEAKQDIGMHSKEAQLQISAKQNVDMRSTEAALKIKAKTETNIVGNEIVDILAGNELKMHGKSLSKLTGGKVHVNKG